MLCTVCCLDGLPSSDPMLCIDSCVQHKPLVNSSLDVLSRGSPKSRSGPCVTYPPIQSSCPSTWGRLFCDSSDFGDPTERPQASDGLAPSGAAAWAKHTRGRELSTLQRYQRGVLGQGGSLARSLAGLGRTLLIALLVRVSGPNTFNSSLAPDAGRCIVLCRQTPAFCCIFKIKINGLIF